MAPGRHRLPDLVVEWDDVPPGSATVIRSERHGELRWGTARLPSGRAGNHRPDGWFIARVNSRTPPKKRMDVTNQRDRDLVREDYLGHRFLQWANEVIAKATIE